MMTEYHCHILPGIDDGAENVNVSYQMVDTMQKQGVQRIVATPHFYAHREQSISSFLRKRQESFELVKEHWSIQDIRLGAEVAVEQGISELPDIEKLAFEGTNLILLELPYCAFANWMVEEIHNVATAHGLQVILAHVHRYLQFYSREEMETILSLDAIMQINNEAWSGRAEKKLARTITKEYGFFVLGSDAHNMTTRKPNWDMVTRKVKPDVIDASNGVLEWFSY